MSRHEPSGEGYYVNQYWEEHVENHYIEATLVWQAAHPFFLLLSMYQNIVILDYFSLDETIMIYGEINT